MRGISPHDPEKNNREPFDPLRGPAQRLPRQEVVAYFFFALGVYGFFASAGTFDGAAGAFFTTDALTASAFLVAAAFAAPAAVSLAVAALRRARVLLDLANVIPVPPFGLRRRAFLVVMFLGLAQARSVPTTPDENRGSAFQREADLSFTMTRKGTPMPWGYRILAILLALLFVGWMIMVLR